jgi:hypothetical protein
MKTLPMHPQERQRLSKFNGPILDRDKLREGTYVTMLTAIASVVLVVAVKVLYGAF